MLTRILSRWPLPSLAVLLVLLTALVMLGATMLVWHHHRQVLQHSRQSLAAFAQLDAQVLDGLSGQYPAYFLLLKIADSARLFEYEMTLLALDSDREDESLQSLYREIETLYRELDSLPRRYIPENISYDDLSENLGVLLGIAEDMFADASSHERQQLHRDCIDPIQLIQNSLATLEQSLTAEAAQLTATTQREMEAEAGNIERIQVLLSNLNRSLLFIFGSALGFIVLLQLLISEVLAGRLRQLREYADAIAQGRFEAAPTLQAADDTQRLAESMQVMSGHLHRTLEELENTAREAEEAQHEAESANRAKSAFLANMSHELRTPLNAILGYAQLLGRDQALSPTQRKSVQIVGNSGEHLLTLINDILDLSKVEAGRVELFPEDFRFQNFIGDISDMFEIRAQQKEIEFHFLPQGELPVALHGDVKRLRQILINLLGNAVKFTKQGAVTLSVAWSEGILDASVEDTGIGIAEEDLEHIFKPFHQAGDHYHHGEGTGLGLSITHKLVTMMGGELSVTSELDRGSRFHLKLPLPEAEGPVAAVVESPERISAYRIPADARAARQGREHYKILVADDKPANREVLQTLLEPLGFALKPVENGREAVEQTQTWQPDLILMDLVMPELDGIRATRKLRAQAEYKALPIIAVSASAFQHQREESLQAGCNAFVVKPYKLDALLHCLQAWLPLEWEYAAAAEDTGETAPAEVEEEAALTPEQADKIHELAIQGSVSALHDYLDTLEQAHPELNGLTAKLRELLEDYDDEGIVELVEQYMD